MPSGTPNYLTANPDGSVGAQFTGTVQAQGLDFIHTDSQQGRTQSVRWMPDSSPGVVGSQYSSRIVGGYWAGSPNNDTGGLTIDAVSVAGMDPARNPLQTPGLARIEMTADNPSSPGSSTLVDVQAWGANGQTEELLLDSGNKSDYVRDVGPSTLPGIVPGGLRAGYEITGGGNVYTSHAGVGSIRWTQRFIVINNGDALNGSPAAQYFDITQPPDGTVISGVNGAPDIVAGSPNAGSINLSAFCALYYILPIGGSSASVPGNFRHVGYTAAGNVPANWVRIAALNSDTPNGTVWVAGRGPGVYYTGYTLNAPFTAYGTPFNVRVFKSGDGVTVIHGLVKAASGMAKNQAILTNIPPLWAGGTEQVMFWHGGYIDATFLYAMFRLDVVAVSNTAARLNYTDCISLTNGAVSSPTLVGWLPITVAYQSY